MLEIPFGKGTVVSGEKKSVESGQSRSSLRILEVGWNLHPMLSWLWPEK